jgi:hypothetical protein
MHHSRPVDFVHHIRIQLNRKLPSHGHLRCYSAHRISTSDTATVAALGLWSLQCIPSESG